MKRPSNVAGVMAGCLLLVGLSLAGYTQAQSTEEPDGQAGEDEKASAETAETGLSVEEILARDPQASDYGEQTRCLRSSLIRSVEVIDDKHVSFRTGKNEYYLVQFKHRCPGLRRGKPVMYEANAGKLCRLDGLRALQETGLGGYRPGMRCAIPEFRAVTKEQLVLLKDALKAEKRKKRES